MALSTLVLSEADHRSLLARKRRIVLDIEEYDKSMNREAAISTV